MANIEKPIWSADGQTLTNVLVNNKNTTYNKVSNWYDGTPMDDSKLDDDFVYVKYEGQYLVRNMEEGQVLQKDSMDEMRSLSTFEILLLKMGVYKHVQLNGYYEKGDRGGGLKYKLSGKVDEDGLSIIYSNGVYLEMMSVQSLNYYNGGARGDGQTSDEESLKLVHRVANKLDIPVINREGEFYIANANSIYVNTDVDLGRSVIRIRESDDSSEERVFIIEDIDSDKGDINLNDLDIESLKNDLNNNKRIISQLEPHSESFLVIYDDYSINRNGYGSSSPVLDMIYVGHDGVVEYETEWNIENITRIRKYDVKYNELVFEGGVFELNVLEGQEKRSPKIDIRRSKTTVQDQVWRIDFEEEISEVEGNVYSMRVCYNSTIKNCICPSRGWTGGAYTISLNQVLGCKIDNFTSYSGEGRWGAMGGNNVKNLLVKNSNISRVDVHFNGINLYIENCNVGSIDVTGRGDLAVRNTFIKENNKIISFRKDWGGFWDGDIEVRDCKIRPTTEKLQGDSSSTDRIHIMRFNIDEDFDYGYREYRKGKSIVINNVEYITDNYTDERRLDSTSIYFGGGISVLNSSENTYLPHLISINNIYNNDNRINGVNVIDLSNVNEYNANSDNEKEGLINYNLNLILSNIKSIPNNDGFKITEGSRSFRDRTPFLNIICVNIQQLNVYVANINCNMNVDNCSIVGGYIKGDRVRKINLSNCDIYNGFSIGNTIPDIEMLNFSNCKVHRPVVGGVELSDIQDIKDAYENIFDFGVGAKGNHLGTELSARLKSKLEEDITKEYLQYLRNTSIDTDGGVMNT